MNYQAGDYLQACINSLRSQSFRDFEIVLVDNASTDGSLENLSTSGIDNLHVFAEQKNHGFAAANNLAAEKANGIWLALLNPDAVAEPDWLQTLYEATIRFPGVKAFASAQIQLEDTSHLDGVGDAYLGFGIPWRGGFGRPVAEMPEEGHCFAACGAGAIYNRETFLSHGGFEEAFFCYCEDVDLGFRLQLAGETCVFLPSARIRHAGSAVSGRNSDFSIYYGTRNRIWTYARCMPASLFWPTLPVHMLLSGYVLIRYSLMGMGGANLKGLWDGFSRALEWRRRTSSLRKARNVSTGELAGIMCWNPFRMHARKPYVRPLNSPQKLTTLASSGHRETHVMPKANPE